jgi:hypothetical protein
MAKMTEEEENEFNDYEEFTRDEYEDMRDEAYLQSIINDVVGRCNNGKTIHA